MPHWGETRDFSYLHAKTMFQCNKFALYLLKKAIFVSNNTVKLQEIRI